MRWHVKFHTLDGTEAHDLTGFEFVQLLEADRADVPKDEMIRILENDGLSHSASKDLAEQLFGYYQ